METERTREGNLEEVVGIIERAVTQGPTRQTLERVQHWAVAHQVPRRPVLGKI